MERNIGKEDWLRAARVALLKGGVSDVQVEYLAWNLGATKDSFYRYFEGRQELLELLLLEWEDGLIKDMNRRLKEQQVRKPAELLIELMVRREPLGEEGLAPSDAAMFGWASVSPEVAQRVKRAERKRLRLLKQILGDWSRAELLYLLWLGFVARAQREPSSRNRFPRVVRKMLTLLRG